MDFSKMIEWLGWNEIPAEFLSSILAMIIILILAVIIRIKLRNYNPKKPHGFLHLVEEIVSFTDRQVSQLMGPAFEGFGGYVVCVGLYIFVSFFIGMIGIPNVFQPGSEWFLEALPNPFTNLAIPLSIALITFTLTHYTSIKYKHWAYFKRYVEPMPFFLPINLISMWSSVLSLTLRLFGNALAGYCVITLIYVGFGSIIQPGYWGLTLTPLLAPIAHVFFDIIDALIQLAVFCMLTMINVANEYISPEELEEAKLEKIRYKEEKQKRKLAKKAHSI